MWCGVWDARVCIGRDKIVPCLSALECFVCSTFAMASLTLCDNRTNTQSMSVQRHGLTVLYGKPPSDCTILRRDSRLGLSAPGPGVSPLLRFLSLTIEMHKSAAVRRVRQIAGKG